VFLVQKIVGNTAETFVVKGDFAGHVLLGQPLPYFGVVLVDALGSVVSNPNFSLKVTVSAPDLRIQHSFSPDGVFSVCSAFVVYLFLRFTFLLIPFLVCLFVCLFASNFAFQFQFDAIN
jgi:hypothetical protein